MKSKRTHIIYLLFTLCFISLHLQAQDTIQATNKNLNIIPFIKGQKYELLHADGIPQLTLNVTDLLNTTDTLLRVYSILNNDTIVPKEYTIKSFYALTYFNDGLHNWGNKETCNCFKEDVIALFQKRINVNSSIIASIRFSDIIIEVNNKEYYIPLYTIYIK